MPTRVSRRGKEHARKVREGEKQASRHKGSPNRAYNIRVQGVSREGEGKDSRQIGPKNRKHRLGPVTGFKKKKPESRALAGGGTYVQKPRRESKIENGKEHLSTAARAGRPFSGVARDHFQLGLQKRNTLKPLWAATGNQVKGKNVRKKGKKQDLKGTGKEKTRRGNRKLPIGNSSRGKKGDGALPREKAVRAQISEIQPVGAVGSREAGIGKEGFGTGKGRDHLEDGGRTGPREGKGRGVLGMIRPWGKKSDTRGKGESRQSWGPGRDSFRQVSRGRGGPTKKQEG